MKATAAPGHTPHRGTCRAVRHSLGILVVALAAIVPLTATVRAGASSAALVTTAGTSLIINGQRTSAVGINARSIAAEAGASAPCAQTQSAAQVIQTMAGLPRGSFLRFEAFQGGYATSPSGTLDFRGIDRVFAAATARHLSLIPVLANGWGQCDDGVRKDLHWFTSGFAAPPTSSLATAEVGRVPADSYLGYVAAFAARYASSPALGMYEPIGEPDAATCSGSLTQDGCSAPLVCHEATAAAALRSFFDTVGAAIKKSDPSHLIEAGFGSNTACGIAGDDLRTVGASAGIDVLSFHDYSGAGGLPTANGTSSDVAEVARAAALAKPIIDAEVGIDAAPKDPGCVTPAQRTTELSYKEAAQLSRGVSGFLVWNVTTGPLGTTCSMSISPADTVIGTVVGTTPAARTPVLAVGATGASLRGANLAGQDLSGQSFAGQDLTGADLDGATITGANFTGATLTGVHGSGLIGTATLPAADTIIGGDLVGPGVSLVGDDLSRLTLTGANLVGADLAGTTLNGTALDGVDLSRSSLVGVTSSGIEGHPILPPHVVLVGGVLVGPGANLAGVTLAPVSLANVDLFGATLSGANLSADGLAGVSSGQITAWGSVTLPAGWQLERGLLLGPGAVLTGQNLSGLTMTGIDLTGATLTGVVAQHLVGCPHLSPSWRCADGELLGPGIDLTWAHIDGLDLSGLSFAGATLVDAELSSDVLTGADLSHATMRSLTTSSLVGAPILPRGVGVIKGMLVGPTAQLAWRDLSGATLAGLNLAGANLNGANLTSADLTGASLAGANLTAAGLQGATLRDASLAKASLVGLVSSGVIGCPTLPVGWVCGGGVLIGPGANLSWIAITGVNLTSASLAGTNLTGARLTGDVLQGTDLTKATLVDVASSGLTGSPLLPATTVLQDGVLINASAQLTFKDLSGANLAGLNLAGADLTGTNLTGANLTGTNLTGAALTGITTMALVGCPTMSAGWTCVGGTLLGPAG